MNDDSIAMHMYWHVLSVLLTGQKKKKKNSKNWSLNWSMTKTILCNISESTLNIKARFHKQGLA